MKIEINLTKAQRRFYEIIPGALSWTLLLGMAILSWIIPFFVALFVIVYDFYIFIRVVYFSIHMFHAYQQMKKVAKINWLEKIKKLKVRADRPAFKDVHHIIILPTYDESLIVLRQSLESLVNTNYPKQNLHVVVGFEERAGKAASTKAKVLAQEFSTKFGTFITTEHPDDIPGEKRVKSANASWAVQQMEKELEKKSIPVKNILVSNFDSDTVVSENYFSRLVYAFLTVDDPYHASYQPLPVYNNNIWDAPSFSRVIAAGSTFWHMIESMRPERLVTFSSHSMTLRALKDVGYWQTNIISEDSRIFWQCLLHYDGNYRTVPLFTTVSMDAALADTWWRTLLNQYKQKRRWAWGIENFPYLAQGFANNKKITFKTKFNYIFRTLEGHVSWATAPIIIAGLGWLPVFVGDQAWRTTVLSYSLPFVTRTIMSVAMSGLIISASISLMLLPARPPQYGRFRHLTMTLQWVLYPIIAMILSAFPALDSETRLMLGRDLQFNVMEKARKKS